MCTFDGRLLRIRNTVDKSSAFMVEYIPDIDTWKLRSNLIPKFTYQCRISVVGNDIYTFRSSTGYDGVLIKQNCPINSNFAYAGPFRINIPDLIAPKHDVQLQLRTLKDSTLEISWDPLKIYSKDAERVGIWYKTGSFPGSAEGFVFARA